MSSLQDKLYNYEQTPPGKVWEKIATALDESHIDDKFPSQLYSAEATPPVATWEKIIASLDDNHLEVVHSAKRSIPIFRYAAAAIIIGIIIFGTIKWAGNNTKESVQKDLATSRTSDTSSKQETTPLENKDAVVKNNEETTSKEGMVKPEQVRTTPVKKLKKKYTVQDNDVDANPVYAYNELSPINLAQRYVMLMTPNGIVRMSKKLGDLVCCVSGQEQDEDCKDQLKKWQEKIACAPVAPSPGNFMDILTLVSSLNNKER
jgi:hypothetical protein